MLFWEIFAIAGVIFLILEIVVPTVFFLNLAVAGFLTAILSLFISNFIILTVSFTLFSILFIMLLRPLILRHKDSKDLQTGIEGKYIGQVAKVIEPISKYKGVISIYDERWEARIDTDEEIPTGSEVRIIRNDSLVMYVEKI